MILVRGFRMTGEIAYARSGDYHIAYQVEGDGRAGIDVLRIGAYVFSLALRLPPPVRAMEAAYAALGRTITFDGRGMGLSDRLRDRRLPPIEERMDDVTAVLDAVGVERALVVAGSDGGPLSCLFAATYPERTLGLVLMNTAPRIAWAPDYPGGCVATSSTGSSRRWRRVGERASTPRSTRPGRWRA